MPGIFAIGAFATVYARKGAEFDYWWHLASGRYTLTMHHLAVPDPFSFTEAGRIWAAHEWLTEVIMYLLHRLFGDAGTLAFFGLCAAATILLTMGALRALGAGRQATELCCAALLLALAPSLGAHADLTALALFAGEMWLLERWIVHRDRSIWILPLLLVLWINLHGSWPAGVAVPLLLLAGDGVAEVLRWPGGERLDARSRRQLAVVLAVSLPALFINANGLTGVLYPFSHFGNPLNQFVAGNQPTAVNDRSAWPFFVFLGIYLAAVAVRRPRLPVADLVLAAAFIIAGLWIWRLVPFAAICLAPLLGRALSLPNEAGTQVPEWLSRLGARYRRRQQRNSSALINQLTGLGVLVGLAAFALSQGPYDVARAAPQPVVAANELGADGLEGPLFNDDTWGGYLTWRFWPQVRVFVDDRGVDLYTQGGVFRDYLDVIGRKPNAQAVLDRYDIQTVLLRKDRPVVRDLLASGIWEETYSDDIVVRLERRNGR
jgi:hypothetical protein